MRLPTVRFLCALALLAGGCALLPGVASAQSNAQQATEERLESLQEQIKRDQQRLEEASEAEQSTRKRLEQLRREIALREELAATYQRRLRELEAERDSLRASLRTLQGRLGTLKEEYRSRVTHAYKYGRLHDLALVLAAESINQMLIRIQYLRRFAQQRQERRSEIQEATQTLEKQREELATKQARTQELLAEARSERSNLQELRADRQSVVADLKEKQSALKADLEEKRSAAQELEKRLRALVASSREESGAASEATGGPSSERLERLSAEFEENRGQLPWPVEGAVTEGFGNRESAYGTTTYHPGILIATNPASLVRCVFSGTVSDVDFVPGYGTYLVIRHGEYLSVYSNFSELYVSEGQSVNAGQLLGQSGTENEPRGAGLFFAVFDKNENASVDPTAWLTNR